MTCAIARSELTDLGRIFKRFDSLYVYRIVYVLGYIVLDVPGDGLLDLIQPTISFEIFKAASPVCQGGGLLFFPGFAHHP